MEVMKRTLPEVLDIVLSKILEWFVNYRFLANIPTNYLPYTGVCDFKNQTTCNELTTESIPPKGNEYAQSRNPYEQFARLETNDIYLSSRENTQTSTSEKRYVTIRNDYFVKIILFKYYFTWAQNYS